MDRRFFLFSIPLSYITGESLISGKLPNDSDSMLGSKFDSGYPHYISDKTTPLPNNSLNGDIVFPKFQRTIEYLWVPTRR